MSEVVKLLRINPAEYVDEQHQNIHNKYYEQNKREMEFMIEQDENTTEIVASMWIYIYELALYRKVYHDRVHDYVTAINFTDTESIFCTHSRI